MYMLYVYVTSGGRGKKKSVSSPHLHICLVCQRRPGGKMSELFHRTNLLKAPGGRSKACFQVIRVRLPEA